MSSMLVLPRTRSTSASRRPEKFAAALRGVPPSLSSACAGRLVRALDACDLALYVPCVLLYASDCLADQKQNP